MKSKSIIKSLHILSACLWLGAATSVVLLHCARGWSENTQELSALNQNFALLDIALIIPGAMGSALTGFLICKTTSWGFTRYWWVACKGIATLVGILIGTVLLGPWQMQMVKLSQLMVIAPDVSPAYTLIRSQFTAVSFLQVLLLVFNIALSVRKPWGKRISRQAETTQIEQRKLSTS